MARIRMTVEWSVPLGQARTITIALHTVMADARSTHGCLGCFVSTGFKEQGTMRYVEEWQTEEDLRRRLASSGFIGLATLIDDATTPPHVEFALPGGTRGLDFVEEVRFAPRLGTEL